MHRFIKAVGAGQKRARPLERVEARQAMSLIADGRAEPVQIGAFLLALRMKGEAAEELAGFAEALDERSERGAAPTAAVDVDAHGDGHLGRATLLPAAAAAAAALGVPVLLRCDLTSPTARHGLRGALEALGLDTQIPLNVARAERALAGPGLAALDLACSCPPLKRLVDLRPLVGVRTVAQTLAKLIDPLRATRRLLGIFHSPYLVPTAHALHLLAPAARALCVQAIGGLPEATAGKQLRVCWSGAAEATLFDLRSFAATMAAAATTEPVTNSDAARENRAALAGEEPAASRAAAACALMLALAREDSPLAAAAEAHGALTSGRARLAAESWRRA